jgi:hypothetical protein
LSRPGLGRSVLLFVAASSLLAVAPRSARADDANDATYLRYHRAIDAEAVCRHHDFKPSDDTRMASYIEGKVHHRIGPDRRLSLIERARLDIDQLVEQRGCDSDAINEFLTVFEAELKPLLAN